MEDVFIFSSEFLDKFPVTYKKAFVYMLIQYHKAPNEFQRLQILQDFGSVFALLPIFWERMTSMKERLLIRRIPLPPLFPFRQILTFTSKIYETGIKLKWKIDHYQWISCAASKEWQDFMYEPEKLLNFPHRDLQEALKTCKEQSVRPIDEKVLSECNKFCELYNLFMRDDLSDEEWMLNLNEIKDEEVVIGLFNHRLGGKNSCFDKNFWSIYMAFLKDKDPNAYLNIYRLYTRFFVEDKEMLEKYRSEIERISKTSMPVSEFWIDTILYEFDFGTKDDAIKVLKRALTSLNLSDYINTKKQDFSLKSCFNMIYKTSLNNKSPNNETFKVPKRQLPISCYFPINQIAALKKTQNFSIPRTIIFYLTQNIKFNHQILQKLFISCKFFFAVQSTPLCYRLVLGCKESSKYRGQSLFLNDKDLEFQGLDNLYIINAFDILSENPTVYSKTIKRMYKCDSKYGFIDNQEFTVNEFKFIRDNFFPEMEAIGSKVILQNGVLHPYNSDIEDLLFAKNA